MKRLTNRKLRLATTLKVIKNGQMVSCVTKQKKTQIFRATEAISFTEPAIKVLLRVNYGIGKNESEHTNKETLLNALRSYTEKKLIDYITNG